MTAKMKIRSEVMEQAADYYRRLIEDDSQESLWPEIEAWLAESDEQAAAYDAVERAWWAAGQLAESESIRAARREAAISLEVDRVDARPARLKIIFAIAATVIAGIFITTMVDMTGLGGVEEGSTTARQAYRSVTGELLPVSLADATEMILDAKSSVDVDYSGDARLVRLMEGRVRFDVTSTPDRQFKVLVQNKVVVALGTVFDVEMIDGDIEVTLLEGSVAVADAVAVGVTEAVQLSPGQRLIIGEDGASETRSGLEFSESSAWQHGRLFFDNEPLKKAVARINRYSDKQLVVADSVSRRVTISGMFEAGDPEALVEALEVYYPGLAREVISVVESGR